MTRKAAIAALRSLPPVASVSVARLRPSDVVVVEVPYGIDQATAERLRSVLKAVWPDNMCAVIGDGAKLKIIRKAGADERLARDTVQAEALSDLRL